MLKIWEKQGEQFFSTGSEPHTVHYGFKQARNGEEEGIIYVGPTHQFESPKDQSFEDWLNDHPFLDDETKARIAEERKRNR